MVPLRTFALAVAVGLSWAGCGGSSSPDSPGAGGAASGAGGANRGGGTAAGGKGGASGGEAGAPDGGGEPGAAGSPSGGGAAGALVVPTSCETDYEGPVAGPRASGPELVFSACTAIPDEAILERYDDPDARVPEGLFWEPPPGAIWAEPCSSSSAETAARAQAEDLGEPEAEYETDWFYEATTCDGSQRRFYRNLRCDYFDGTTLANAGAEELGFLASLLWWQDHFNLSGAALLGYGASIGDATDAVELCTIETVYGDFGLCDSVSLFRTRHTVLVTGMVTLGEPELVRTIQGECH